MDEDVAKLNDQWALKIIDQLISSGINHFFIAPGSRSSPLTLAAAKNKHAINIIHFDERGLCFQALGYGKGSSTAAAIIVTSGTAVGNLLPAIMEAHSSYVPMIILTADRPPELRNCGANQTVDQVKIFQEFTKWSIDLPCADQRLMDNYITSVMTYAAHICQQTPMGPVHINCMFREPLHSNPVDICTADAKSSIFYNKSRTILSEDTIDHIVEKLCQAKNGLIITGSMPSKKAALAAIHLSRSIHWPLVSDITSQFRSTKENNYLIKYFDCITKSIDNLEVDCVIHLGDRLISKTLANWLKKQTMTYINVTEHQDRFDPYDLKGDRMSCDLCWFSNEISRRDIPSSNLFFPLHLLSQQVEDILESFVTGQNKITELTLPMILSKVIPSEWSIFFGNSMPARDADNFFYPYDLSGQIFLNRGVSGIDGNVSTVIGLARAIKTPILAVFGDLTLLHDMTALTQIIKSPYPIIIVVINNHGGGIFSFLPIADHSDVFEEYFATSHNLSIELLAKFANIDFFSPKDVIELQHILSNVTQKPKHCIIELVTCRKENVKHREQIHHFLKDQLCLQPHVLET